MTNKPNTTPTKLELNNSHPFGIRAEVGIKLYPSFYGDAHRIIAEDDHSRAMTVVIELCEVVTNSYRHQ